MKYLYPKQVLHLYQQIIERTGGTLGLRDEGLLESADTSAPPASESSRFSEQRPAVGLKKHFFHAHDISLGLTEHPLLRFRECNERNLGGHLYIMNARRFFIELRHVSPNSPSTSSESRSFI